MLCFLLPVLIAGVSPAEARLEDADLPDDTLWTRGQEGIGRCRIEPEYRIVTPEQGEWQRDRYHSSCLGKVFVDYKAVFEIPWTFEGGIYDSSSKRCNFNNLSDPRVARTRASLLEKLRDLLRAGHCEPPTPWARPVPTSIEDDSLTPPRYPELNQANFDSFLFGDVASQGYLRFNPGTSFINYASEGTFVQNGKQVRENELIHDEPYCELRGRSNYETTRSTPVPNRDFTISLYESRPRNVGLGSGADRYSYPSILTCDTGYGHGQNLFVSEFKKIFGNMITLSFLPLRLQWPRSWPCTLCMPSVDPVR